MVIVIGRYNHKIFNKNIYRLILLNVCQASGLNIVALNVEYDLIVF